MPDLARRLSLPPAGEVDVWWWALDLPSEALATLLPLLSPDEQARSECFQRPVDRTRFVAARGRLREVLGAYAGLPPASLEIATASLGKPFLAGASRAAAPGLRFSLSHSGGMAALAVTDGAEVGLDIEVVRPVERAVASASFAPEEVAALEALAPGDWLAGFYRCWTRREAVLKASGQGLGGPPGELVVSLDPDAAVIVKATGALAGASRWSLLPFALSADAPGAVAVARDGAARVRAIARWA